MHDTIQIEGGHVTANLEERTITGLLIPYGEEGRTNQGRFMVEAGAVDISEATADPSIIGLNLDHTPWAGVGRASRVWEQHDGVYASWSIATTPAGDAALADAVSPTGKRKRLSGEFGPVMIRAGKLVAGHARLWGSALVPAGAFPSAMVLAADTPDAIAEPEAPEEASTSRYVTRFTDADGAEWERVSESTSTTTVTKVSGEEPADEQEQSDTEGESQVTATATPATHRGAAPAAVTKSRDSDLRQVLAALNAVRLDRHDTHAMQVLAALSDIKSSGNGSLLSGANGSASIVRPKWIGELQEGIEFTREFITLGKLGTDVSLEGKQGYTLHRRSATTGTTEMEITGSTGTWAGNKTDISSHSAFTKTAQSTRRNFAVGNDLGREFWDLEGGLEVVQAYLRMLVEEYFIWSDDNANADWITAAGTPIAPAIADYDSGYPSAMGMVMQGILAVKKRKGPKRRRDVPTFAILNEAAYTDIAYALGGDQNLPAFVEIRVSTDGTGQAETVQLVSGDTGIDNTPSVIVGARPAIEFDELPGGPLQIDALDIAKGGIDKAIHGYLQTFQVRPEAVVSIGVADA